MTKILFMYVKLIIKRNDYIVPMISRCALVVQVLRKEKSSSTVKSLVHVRPSPALHCCYFARTRGPDDPFDSKIRICTDKFET